MAWQDVWFATTSSSSAQTLVNNNSKHKISGRVQENEEGPEEAQHATSGSSGITSLKTNEVNQSPKSCWKNLPSTPRLQEAGRQCRLFLFKHNQRGIHGKGSSARGKGGSFTKFSVARAGWAKAGYKLQVTKVFAWFNVSCIDSYHLEYSNVRFGPCLRGIDGRNFMALRSQNSMEQGIAPIKSFWIPL